MQIYNVYQSGKRLYIDEKENPDNKIVVNKYDNMQQTLRLISDGTLPPRLYWALRNPKLSQKYFILKLVNNKDLIVGTDISATPGLWDMLLIGTDEDYIIEGADIDQSRLTYVSDHFGRLFVRDNFLEELDFEEQCSPTFKVFYDEIMFRLDNIPDLSDIPDKMSDLENDTNFISGVAFKDDGQGNVKIIGTTFSGGETEEGGGGSGGNIEVDNKLDEESTNPVQNRVIAKEVNGLKQKDESLDKEVIALQERNAELEQTVEKLQIKTTTSPSPFHHITDSANMKVVDFGMEGKTEQFTTSGKNLWNAEYARDVNNWSKVKGSNYPSIPVFVGAGNVITMSYKQQLAGGIGFYFAISRDGMHNNLYDWMYHSSTTGLITNEITFTAESDYIYPCYYEQKNLDLFMQYIGNDLQIEINPVATAYEPFTNGPSPNPDYPQEIVNAGVYNEETGRYEIGCGVGNENLLPSDHNEWFLNHGSAWSARPGTKPSIDRGYTYNSCIIIDVRPDTPVCFHNDTTDKYWVSRIIEIDNDGIGLSQIGFYVNESYNFKDYSFKTSSKTHKLIIDVRLIDKTQMFTEADLQEMKIIFGYGDSVSYTPHASQQFTLTSPVPLTKWDKLVKRDGVWGWSILSYEDFNDGSADEAWRVANRTTSGVFFVKNLKVIGELGLINSIGTAVSDRFIETNPQSAIGNYTLVKGATLRAGLSDDNITTVDEFKAFIAEHPFKVLYKTNAEQAFHPLPDEEQELLHNLETYYGVTNLYNDQGCPMWLCYTCDSKLYVDQKLEQINNALLSLGANV